MIPAVFEYVRVGSVEDAIGHLVDGAGDAKLLAGGHSLLPLMKLRLATPATLVDLGAIPELSAVREEDGVVRIGPLARHCDLAASEVVQRFAPLLAHAASRIGDPQVRHRGTIGGSLAHGDPASDLPAALLALDGSVVAQGPGGVREISAAELFVGFLETALAEDEVLIEVRVPVQQGGWGFEKFTRRAQDWAIVGVAVTAAPAGPGIALVNMHQRPVRASATEAHLASGASVADAAALADEGCEPPSDLNASEDYRRHLARVLTRRALESAGY